MKCSIKLKSKDGPNYLLNVIIFAEDKKPYEFDDVIFHRENKILDSRIKDLFSALEFSTLNEACDKYLIEIEMGALNMSKQEEVLFLLKNYFRVFETIKKQSSSTRLIKALGLILKCFHNCASTVYLLRGIILPDIEPVA